MKENYNLFKSICYENKLELFFLNLFRGEISEEQYKKYKLIFKENIEDFTTVLNVIDLTINNSKLMYISNLLKTYILDHQIYREEFINYLELINILFTQDLAKIATYFDKYITSNDIVFTNEDIEIDLISLDSCRNTDTLMFSPRMFSYGLGAFPSEHNSGMSSCWSSYGVNFGFSICSNGYINTKSESSF